MRFWLQKIPGLKGLAERALDGLLGLALRSQVRVEAPARTYDEEELLARADEYHRAAERYFIEAPDADFLRRKPFSENPGFAERLFDLGVLLHGLRLRPGDRVLDLGAGSCWASHFLHRHGCQTVAVDVSVAALALGRQLFVRSSHTSATVPHAFLSYDGLRLPLADASVDRILVNDAFHHVPDQRGLLREMVRVLRPGGIVAMHEPGATHASTPQGKLETERTGVLENDIVIEDLAVLAESCGFSRVTVVPVALAAAGEVPAQELVSFLRGGGVSHYWRRLAEHLQVAHYILLYHGEQRPDSLRSSRLGAAITVDLGIEPRAFRAFLLNTGDSRWLARSPRREGCMGQVRLGVHLHGAGDSPGLRLVSPRSTPRCRARAGGGGRRLAARVPGAGLLPAGARPGRGRAHLVRLRRLAHGLGGGGGAGGGGELRAAPRIRAKRRGCGRGVHRPPLASSWRPGRRREIR